MNSSTLTYDATNRFPSHIIYLISSCKAQPTAKLTFDRTQATRSKWDGRRFFFKRFIAERSVNRCAAGDKDSRNPPKARAACEYNAFPLNPFRSQVECVYAVSGVGIRSVQSE